MLWIINMGIIMSSAGDDWNLTELEKGVLGACFMFGMFVGCYFWGYFADRRGRMFAFRKTVIIGGLATLALTFSVNYYMMCVLTILVGAGVGGEICMGGVVFQEYCPPSKQWMLALLSVFWCLGGTLGAFVALIGDIISPPFALWRWVSGVGTLIQFVYWLIRLKVSETPRYLYMNFRYEEAEATLQSIADEIGNNMNVKIDQIDLKPMGTLDNSLKESLVQKENSSIMRELFGKKYFRVTTATLCVFFLINLAYIGITDFMPQLLKDSGGGINGVMLYLTMVVQQASGIPGVLVSTWLVETWMGRKYTLAGSAIVSGMFCFLFLIADSYAMVSFT